MTVDSQVEVTEQERERCEPSVTVSNPVTVTVGDAEGRERREREEGERGERGKREERGEREEGERGERERREREEREERERRGSGERETGEKCEM